MRWSMPDEPDSFVTAVKDCDGNVWRLRYAPPGSAWEPYPEAPESALLPWSMLVFKHGPLTRVLGEEDPAVTSLKR